MATPLVGTLYPVLADVVGRVTWFPFLVGLWTDQWVWGSLIGLVYHFMVYLPLREISNPALTAAQEFPSLEEDATARQFYMIVMPVCLLSAAVVGSIVRRLLKVPFHFVPIGRLIRNVWPIREALLTSETQPLVNQPTIRTDASLGTVQISQRYSIYATVAFVLAVGGGLASQEIYAWVHGGGDLTLDWIMAFLPLVLSILVLIPCFFFDANETYAIFGTGAGVRTRALIAAGKIVGCTGLVTCIPQIVAIYVRNANAVILTASLCVVGALLISVVLANAVLGDIYEAYRVPMNRKTQEI